MDPMDLVQVAEILLDSSISSETSSNTASTSDTSSGCNENVHAKVSMSNLLIKISCLCDFWRDYWKKSIEESIAERIFSMSNLLYITTLLILYTNPFFVAAQTNRLVEDRVREVFSMNSGRRSGFGIIVTPEPDDRSLQQINFTSIRGREPCHCVPYHKCDPRTNSVIPSVDDDSPFDGFGQLDIRFGDDITPTCPNAIEKCCDENRIRNASLTPTPATERPNQVRGCGIRNVNGIDVELVGANNYEAGYAEYPWVVALMKNSNSEYFCAGSLIHPQVVLTGTHCVIDVEANSFFIRAGEWDTQTTAERLPHVERSVRRIITHPSYNYRNIAYDFALLILSEPIELDVHINVICLPPQNSAPIPPVTCFAAGWGKDKFGEAGRWSNIMKSVPLPIVQFNECQDRLRRTRLGPRFALDSSFICAGGVPNIDTCKGDGGAPLVCPIGLRGENRYQQNGIVAWGIGCNDAVPAAYANVALARNWIDQQMLANGFDTQSYSS